MDADGTAAACRLLCLWTHSRRVASGPRSCAMDYAAGISKSLWREEDRVFAYSHLLPGVFHAGSEFSEEVSSRDRSIAMQAPPSYRKQNPPRSSPPYGSARASPSPRSASGNMNSGGPTDQKGHQCHERTISTPEKREKASSDLPATG